MVGLLKPDRLYCVMSGYSRKILPPFLAGCISPNFWNSKYNGQNSESKEFVFLFPSRKVLCKMEVVIQFYASTNRTERWKKLAHGFWPWNNWLKYTVKRTVYTPMEHFIYCRPSQIFKEFMYTYYLFIYLCIK